MTHDPTLGSKVVSGLLRITGIMMAVIFIAAGSFDFWQAWLFLSVFIAANILCSMYFLKHDPELIRRRLKAGPRAEKERPQKRIMAAASLLFLLLVILPGLDFRYGWLPLPAWVALLGDGLVVLGYAIIFRVFQENSFASSIIEVGAGQRVISSGPYRVVRHPMYSGALVLLLGVPLALGSLYSAALFALLVPVLIGRINHEEQFLSAHLAGYTQYREKIRYRLVPGLY